MVRREERFSVTTERPDLSSLTPIERDAVTGLPIRLDHQDKSRQQDRRPEVDRQPPLRRGRGRVRQFSIAGAAAAVLILGGAIFLIGHGGGNSNANPTLNGQTGAPVAGTSSLTGSDPVRTPPSSQAQLNSTLPPPSSRAELNSVVPVVSGRTTAPARSPGPAGRSTAGSAQTGPPRGNAVADAGFNGTYRAEYRITAATGTAVAEIGTTTRATLKVRTTCSANGSCSTVIAINGTPQKPETAAGVGKWTDKFSGQEKCREYYTGKLSGGSYPYQVQTTYQAGATTGSSITALSGTQTLTQLRKCPTQTNELYSRTASFTMTRTGP